MRRAFLLFAALSLAGCTMRSGTGAPAAHFAVFFQEWSAGLDHPALATIKTAAAAANRSPSLPLSVTGYADPLGSEQANIFLSETRAQVVIDQLVADGVTRDRIHRHAAGIVGYKLTSQESRRVVITLGRS
ncbi:MAG: OmpA family protein [Acetobacteraceae bacterium]